MYLVVVLGNWIDQWSNAWGRWETVFGDSHKGNYNASVFIKTLWNTWDSDAVVPIFSASAVSVCVISLLWNVSEAGVLVVMLMFVEVLFIQCCCIFWTGTVRLMWTEAWKRQQGHHCIKHHVCRWPVSSVPESTLAVPKNCCQQIVWIHARFVSSEFPAYKFFLVNLLPFVKNWILVYWLAALHVVFIFSESENKTSWH